MAQDINVYQLVRSFAQRNRLLEVEYRIFAQAVQRQAMRADQTNPLFRELSISPDTVLLPRLFALGKERRLILETQGNEIVKLIFPEYYSELFFQEYRRMDENPEVPFPDEETLGVLVPPTWIQAVALESDLGLVSEQREERSVPLLYRLVFPESVKPIVVPAAYVPEKLIEYAVLKIRHYLRRDGNKEYVYNKLLYAFASKEVLLKEVFGTVLTKPYEAIEELKKSSSDFTFSFWAYLMSYVKKDLDKKTDKTGEDLSIYQAALLCEFYANHYKGRAQRLVDLDTAFKSLAQELRKSPYFFTIDEISLFKDGKGQPLLGKYNKAELENWLKDTTTKAEPGTLPDLLVIPTGQGSRFYVAKDHLFPLVLRLVGEARAELRTTLMEDWRRLLGDFRSIPAMNDDGAYRHELGSRIEKRFPLLDALLQDRLLPLVHDELIVRGGAPAELERFFYKGDLVPLDELLDLPRKPLLTDAKMLLPFWYSIPFLAALARLFRKKPKKEAPQQRKTSSAKLAAANRPERDSAPVGTKTVRDRRAEFAQAAATVTAQLLPSGYSADEYLRELVGRWNTLLDAQAKANLTEDVNSLVRDYLRRALRTMRGESLTLERVRGLATTLADTPTLLKIKNHSALELYLQLYMMKVLSH